MKLLLKLLLLISLFLSGGHSLFACPPTTGNVCNVVKIDQQAIAALQENINTPAAENVHAHKASTRKNCRKLLIIDDEDDETPSFKKSKQGKTLPAIRAARNLATVYYNTAYPHLLAPNTGRITTGQNILLPSCNNLFILFQVFRI